MSSNDSKENILLSIIVPIYNAEEKLQRCLDSLGKINYKNIEILLIDDGSTDNSGAICDSIVKMDKRFRYTYKSNGGVSSARNCGLRKASGKYIFFVDSDDYIEGNFFKVIELLNEGNIDTLGFLYSRTEFDQKVNGEIKVIDRNELLEKLKSSSYSNDFGYVWNKIYKKQIIDLNNILFEEEISEREDFLFNIDYFKHIDSITFYKEKIYFYIQYEGSLSKRKNEKEFLSDIISLFETKLKDNYLKQSILIEDIVLEVMADYIVKSVFSRGERYKDINQDFKELLIYSDYIEKSHPYNLYLNILKRCFKYKKICMFYFYYKLSLLKKNIKLLRNSVRRKSGFIK